MVERKLDGVRVAVTRPEEAATELVDGLRALGADVTVHPLIRVTAPADAAGVRAAARDAPEYDWVVFTSANAVRWFAAALRSEGVRLGAGPRPAVAAVGPATAATLVEEGIAVAVEPADFQGRALPDAMASVGALAGARVLLPRSAIGREELPALLRAAGARVTDVAVYRTLPDEDGARNLAAALAAGSLDIVTFTSPSTVRALAAVCPALPREVRVAVIGPTTADAARAVGYRVSVVPEHYTATGLVEAVAELVDREDRADVEP